jgi:thiol-disulfide isomerase/thioredoxin
VAADFTLPDLAGTSHTLSKLRGKVVLLDFWASWCGPCRMTMPVIDKLASEFRGKGLVVYSVNLREPQSVAEGYIKKKGLSLPVLLDERGDVAGKYQVVSIPSLVIVGRDGKVSSHMVGAHPEEDLREALSDAGIR